MKWVSKRPECEWGQGPSPALAILAPWLWPAWAVCNDGQCPGTTSPDQLSCAQGHCSCGQAQQQGKEHEPLEVSGKAEWDKHVTPVPGGKT